MNNTKLEILNKIKEYDNIVIARHFRPDGDAIGSSKGLKRILELTFPQKKIVLCNKDYSDYLSFLGEEDGEISEAFIKNALTIVLDTATRERVSDQKVFLGKEVIKIDHHPNVDPYGSLSLVEDKRSSCSEIIADFYNTFSVELKIDEFAATCIYTGMNTDSGRFRFSTITGETLRLAGLMLDKGVDVEMLQSHLDLKDINFYKYQAAVFDKIVVTENGLAYLYIDLDMQKEWGLSREAASESVSFLNFIKGAIAWMAFIENNDNSIRVRLRSRFMKINHIAERYHGGGHEKAAGATCYTKEEVDNLIKDVDNEVKLYKATHDRWL